MHLPQNMDRATEVETLRGRLPLILAETHHDEIWGVKLQPEPDHIPTIVVLQKFIRANVGSANSGGGGVVEAAAEQLKNALVWHRDMKPHLMLEQDAFDLNKFDGLGFVTTHSTPDGSRPVIITWNLYGSVSDKKATFGNVEDFIAWRATLMESGVRRLELDKATRPIPEGGQDPYQMIQVHDYDGVSFFRMDPDVRASSKKTIEVLSLAYPELLRTKYFVNVPAVMGFVFGIMKRFVSEATLRKFHPMSSGLTLKDEPEMAAIAATLPCEYGGQGASVKVIGTQVRLADPPVRNVHKNAGKATAPAAGDGNVDIAVAPAGPDTARAGEATEPHS